MRRSIGLAALLGAMGMLAGCSDFERIDFAVGAAPPVDIVVSYDLIRIPEGVAIIATATPTAGDGVMSRDTKVQLNSLNSAVLGVALSLPNNLDSDSDRAEWTYVLFGVGEGSTILTVRVDDDVKKEIPVTVQAQ